MKNKLIKLALVATALLTFTGCDKKIEPKPTESKPKEVTIYLTRHGKTMLNTTDRSQGWIDAPLTPAGVEVAEQLGKGFKAEGIKFDAVYSSDSGRAVETATTVLNSADQKELIKSMVTDKGLREFNFGTFEGQPNEEMWEHIAKAQGKTLEEWQAGMGTDGFVKTIVGFADTLHKLDLEKLEALAAQNKTTADKVSYQAESYDEVVSRAKASFEKLAKTSSEKGQSTVLVTSHGMTISALVTALDASAAAKVPATGLKNASVQKIVYKDGKFTVQTVNDLSFVEKGAK